MFDFCLLSYFPWLFKIGIVFCHWNPIFQQQYIIYMRYMHMSTCLSVTSRKIVGDRTTRHKRASFSFLLLLFLCFLRRCKCDHWFRFSEPFQSRLKLFKYAGFMSLFVSTSVEFLWALLRIAMKKYSKLPLNYQVSYVRHL